MRWCHHYVIIIILVRKARKPPPHNPKEGEKGHSDVWSRLEQLEEEEKEFIRREAEEGEWEEEEEELSERADEGGSSLPGRSIIIPVRHTRTEDKKEEEEEEEEEEEVSDNQTAMAARFTSPADIFRHYSNREKEKEEEKEEEEEGEGSSTQVKKTVSWEPGLAQHGHPEEGHTHSDVHKILPQHRTRTSKPHAVVRDATSLLIVGWRDMRSLPNACSLSQAWWWRDNNYWRREPPVHHQLNISRYMYAQASTLRCGCVYCYRMT